MNRVVFDYDGVLSQPPSDEDVTLLSNAPGDVAAAVSGLPVAAHFGHLVFSCELKTGKPDAACFSAALARLGARPEDVVLIDDRPENTREPAVAAGRDQPDLWLVLLAPVQPAHARGGFCGKGGVNPGLTPGGTGWLAVSDSTAAVPTVDAKGNAAGRDGCSHFLRASAVLAAGHLRVFPDVMTDRRA